MGRLRDLPSVSAIDLDVPMRTPAPDQHTNEHEHPTLATLIADLEEGQQPTAACQHVTNQPFMGCAVYRPGKSSVVYHRTTWQLEHDFIHITSSLQRAIETHRDLEVSNVISRERLEKLAMQLQLSDSSCDDVLKRPGGMRRAMVEFKRYQCLLHEFTKEFEIRKKARFEQIRALDEVIGRVEQLQRVLKAYPTALQGTGEILVGASN